MARFAAGDRVRVHKQFPPTPPSHIRTPYYIRGLSGTVERVCGAFRNPEELAFGRPGTPEVPLYRVRFRQKDVWPDYEGNEADKIEIEIFEFWLDAEGDEA
ncbi:MAG: nitrile hydratase subunit beta [Nisaea sp.]|jgi:nitrile hydratase|uniref:SH3-like domain-containing protein n=1 Tax=Nisaea sp. TaxID=2024842 RepID=UPI001B2CF1E7|nr:SH3-like domain-containing protein [Nisaea sp.]MBO6559229.1 nitrile hydratase subunit beta [Nisaea sp.]